MQVVWKVGFFVQKRSVFEPRSQSSNKKSSKNCLEWEKWLKLTYLDSFQTIYQSDDLGSFFRLMRRNCGLSTFLLSTKKHTFRTTWMLAYKGPINILTPLGLALSELGSIWIFFYIFSIFFVNQKNYHELLFLKLAPIRVGLMWQPWPVRTICMTE